MVAHLKDYLTDISDNADIAVNLIQVIFLRNGYFIVPIPFIYNVKDSTKCGVLT